MARSLKVLFLYPNVPLQNPPPVSIGILSALLRAEGVEVKVFDTTFYHTAEISSDKAKEKSLQVDLLALMIVFCRMEGRVQGKICVY